MADDWEARKALVIDVELEDFFALMTRKVHERNRRCEQRCGEYRDFATDGASPNDDRDLLIGLKETTKALRAAADSDYTNGVLTAVYYLCAASALVAWHDKIVNLPSERLAENLGWLADQTWGNPCTREQAQLAIGNLQTPRQTLAEPAGGNMLDQVA